ncbi:carbohydrate kinase [Alphaproteobacteria bacterium GH1-50]|uniref:Carbohydrate kinase n=1 Tax=Kangsaoukella pontilimi TaxID=2691042 RepID=A0A7C9IQN0_9RHOB|nr:carbohydrate kinase [Kangsaoukella pontilimi]MXQ06466.1 carbohydrate kinase [Kangsaoukella pontilimi]
MILCSGEALIDMLPRETTAGENAFAPHAGGSVFNTAIALGRLGTPVSFFSGLSTDLFGQVLVDALAASGVSAELAHRADRPTTLAFVTLTNGQASYAFYDENTAGRMLSEDELPAVPDDVTAMFFGGISLAVEPCASTYEALCLREAPRRVTMVDPNIRPRFIRDEATYRARIERIVGAADVVKLSDEDLAWLTGNDDTHDGARQLLSKGPAVICVTRGSEGVEGHTPDGIVTVPARKVQVVDTVGAGDTFNAGFLAALHDAGALTKTSVRQLDEDTLEAALTLGVRAAAVTVSRAGANPPRRDEL